MGCGICGGPRNESGKCLVAPKSAFILTLGAGPALTLDKKMRRPEEELRKAWQVYVLNKSHPPPPRPTLWFLLLPWRRVVQPRH